jgi:uncharacterized protein
VAVVLLDVNVLVALVDADHVHHEVAHDWFTDHGAESWATCPLTENGFIRVLSNPAYQGSELRPEAIVGLLRRFCGRAGHHAWGDVLSLRDSTVFDVSFVRGHRQVTDVYLLGLAHHMNGQLATFDRTIPLKAIKGATPDLLQIVESLDE